MAPVPTDVTAHNGFGTASEWSRAGRIIRKGEHALWYRLNDERTEGRAVFSYDQTEIASQHDASDAWTVHVDAGEWQQIKALRTEARQHPRVKVRKPAGGGAEVWCGPDLDVINLLKAYGFTFNPSSRYWYHPGKDAETIAKAFQNGKIRERPVRVERAWTTPDGPVL